MSSTGFRSCNDENVWKITRSVLLVYSFFSFCFAMELGELLEMIWLGRWENSPSPSHDRRGRKSGDGIVRNECKRRIGQDSKYCFKKFKKIIKKICP